MSWAQLRPLFESMLFDLGHNEVARRTQCGNGTIYRLANGEVGRPQPRTIRDIRRAVEKWLVERDSQTERTAQ